MCVTHVTHGKQQRQAVSNNNNRTTTTNTNTNAFTNNVNELVRLHWLRMHSIVGPHNNNNKHKHKHKHKRNAFAKNV
jgi:hypothetical protein